MLASSAMPSGTVTGGGVCPGQAAQASRSRERRFRWQAIRSILVPPVSSGVGRRAAVSPIRACRQASRSAAKAWAVRAMTGVWREPFSGRGFQRALAQREQRLRRLPTGNAAVEALFAFRRDGQDGVEIDQRSEEHTSELQSRQYL